LSWLLAHVSWIWEFALPFGIVLGVVVLFHEFGHYLVAKWLGVTVEIFSVGFGPRIGGFHRGGTDYRVSWVPLGGYVKLKGETPEEGSVPEPGDLMSRSRVQRFLVFVMGAVFNLVTAYVLTVAILMMGVQEPVYPSQPPVVGEIDPDSPAATSGIQAGDRILSVGGQAVRTWRDLELAIVLSPGQTREIELDEQYNIMVLEDAVPKPVISGGEEDLANLVLRLAISEMIAAAARTGSPACLPLLLRRFCRFCPAVDA